MLAVNTSADGFVISPEAMGELAGGRGKLLGHVEAAYDNVPLQHCRRKVNKGFEADDSRRDMTTA